MRQSLQKLNTRILALAMAVMLLLCSVPAVHAAEDSGTCGKDLSWSLNGDTLTITGSGAMDDFPESTMAPWYAYRGEIARVQLPEGLTRIGDLAFYGCSALEIVFLPDSVTEIGWHAFAGCTALTMLDLSSNLQIIEDGAFRECTALPSVRLPQNLTKIGYRGFYRCESLTEITVPASVKEFGTCMFSFCYNLIRADIQAPITSLPVWTFYGCSRLTDVILPASLENVEEFAFYDCDGLSNVVYPGSEEDKEEIIEDIERDLAGQPDPSSAPQQPGTPTPSNPSAPSNPGGAESGTPEQPQTGKPGSPVVIEQPQEKPSSSTIVEGDDNSGVIENTTTTQTENASVSATLVINYSVSEQGSTSAKVTVTLETANAWGEISEQVTEVVEEADEATIDVYIKDNTSLERDVWKTFMGKKVIVTIRNASGSVWRIDCSQIDEDNGMDACDLSYERLNATAEQLELLGCTVGYQIKFRSDAQVNAEVMIKLPVENARKNASLYQVKLGGGKDLLQSVVVDDAGYAHFYLASVDSRTEYLIGIDVQEVASASAIIPEVLQQEYGVTDKLSNVDYVITGRTSSWGMNFKQVTLIMAGVMLSVVVVVGFVMYGLNKRKLKMGYIPDLDEEDYE